MNLLKWELLAGVTATIFALWVDTTMGALVAGVLGGVLAHLFISSLAYRTGELGFHEGVVCIGGIHIPYLFWIVALGGPRMMGAILGSLTVFGALDSDSSYRAFALLPGAAVYMATQVASGAVMGVLLQGSKWLSYFVDLYGEMSHKPSPSIERAIPLFEAETQRLFDDDHAGIHTVAEYERFLVWALVLRGCLFGQPRELVEKILKESAYKDPDERRRWLEQNITEENWPEIERAYRGFALEVGQAQNRARHMEDNGGH